MLLTRGLLRTPRVWGEMGFGVKRPSRPGISFLSPLSLSSMAHQQGSRPAPWLSQYQGDGKHPRGSITHRHSHLSFMNLRQNSWNVPR